MLSKSDKDLVSKSGDNVLEYFDKSHRYLFNGNPLRSMTWIKKGYPTPFALVKWQVEKGPKEANRIMREAGAIGTFVHEFVYRKRTGITEFNDLEAQMRGHKNESEMRTGLASANLWLAATKNILEKAEVICCSPKLQVSGKFDELARLEPYPLPGVVDYKTSGNLSIDHFQQAAGYRRLILDWFGIKTGWIQLIHLQKDKVGFHVATIDDKGLWYDGELRIDDPEMLTDMDDQFVRNIPTAKYVNKYEYFWQKIR